MKTLKILLNNRFSKISIHKREVEKLEDSFKDLFITFVCGKAMNIGLLAAIVILVVVLRL